MIAISSILNIFNTISSSIILRKREFAILKSIGISEKQTNKMMLLEAIFYGIDAIVYGVIISIAILYIVYLILINTNLYSFEVPLISIILVIVTVYVSIFVAIVNTRRKLKKKNIIEEIREENI